MGIHYNNLNNTGESLACILFIFSAQGIPSMESSVRRNVFFIPYTVKRGTPILYFSLLPCAHDSNAIYNDTTPRMLQGEILAFYCTFVSLRGHIFAGIEKFGLHV